MTHHKSLLEVENLGVEFNLSDRKIIAIESISLHVHAGETVGIVGESGSGKSVTALAIMGLIRPPGKIFSGKVNIGGEDLLRLSSAQRRKYLGRDISMVFQEPVSSLNPSFTIGDQILEALSLHGALNRRARYQRALELMHVVGIPEPEKCLKSWPHQLSGGMNQRVMIAMAISCNPSLLIADEPTTALDVTIQAQILALLFQLQQKNNMGMIFITHDLLVVSSIAQRVVVMYAGQIVEVCAVDDLFKRPLHPYSEALVKSLPAHYEAEKDLLSSIRGTPPIAGETIQGCRFYPRCDYARDECQQRTPDLITLEHTTAHQVRCFYPLTDTQAGSKQDY